MTNSSASSPQETPDMGQYSKLFAVLRQKQQDLPPEVQNALQATQIADTKTITRQLHNAVSQLGSAKKQLATLAQARTNLHQSWTSFIKESVERWKKHAEDFQEQDAKIVKQIEEATKKLQVSQENFQQCQHKAGEAGKTEVIELETEDELPRACHECGKEPLGNGFKPRRNGREDGTGRACDQEKKDGRSKRSKGGKAWCSAIIMIFGRQVCAPFQTTCWGHAVPCWAHSALQMSDFLPPWKAIEDAVQLAWELGLSHPTVAREGQPRTPNTVHKTVSFEENVEIRFYSGSVAANSTIQHSIFKRMV